MMGREKVSWGKRAEVVELYLRGEVGYQESVEAANKSRSSQEARLCYPMSTAAS